MRADHIHIYIVSFIIITCISGTIWNVIWLAVTNLAQKKGHIRTVYILLKCTMIGYVFSFPVGRYLTQVVFYDYWRGFQWKTTDYVYIILSVLCIMWFAGLIVYLTRFVLSALDMRKYRRGRFLPSGQEAELLEEIRNRLHISRRIRIYHGYNVDSPFSTNFLKPTIYLTAKEYDPDELRVILTHELYHIKYHDIFWKPAFNLVNCIYWFNPLAWNLTKQFRRWTEANCDNHCYEDHFTEDEYAGVIIRTMKENPQYVNLFSSNWCENKSDILWRFLLMQKCLEKQWNPKVSVIAIVVIVMICIGMTGALEYGMERLYYYACRESQSTAIVEDRMEVAEGDELVGQYSDMGQWTEDLGYMLATNSDEDNLYTYVQLEESMIMADQRARTEFFQIEAGDEIRLSVNSGTSDQLLQVGIVDEEGHYWAVQGYNEVTYTLHCPDTGNYAIYVENKSSEDLSIWGICLIWHLEE